MSVIGRYWTFANEHGGWKVYWKAASVIVPSVSRTDTNLEEMRNTTASYSSRVLSLSMLRDAKANVRQFLSVWSCIFRRSRHPRRVIHTKKINVENSKYYPKPLNFAIFYKLKLLKLFNVSHLILKRKNESSTLWRIIFKLFNFFKYFITIFRIFTMFYNILIKNKKIILKYIKESGKKIVLSAFIRMSKVASSLNLFPLSRLFSH